MTAAIEPHVREIGSQSVPEIWRETKFTPLDLQSFLLFCIWTDNGYIEGKELDDFFRHMMKRLGPQVSQPWDKFIHNWRWQL